MDEEGLVSIHLGDRSWCKVFTMIYLSYFVSVGNGPPDMEGYNFIFQCIKVIEHRGEWVYAVLI